MMVDSGLTSVVAPTSSTSSSNSKRKTTTLPPELTSHSSSSSGNLQIFSYWVSNGSRGSPSLPSISNLSLGEGEGEDGSKSGCGSTKSGAKSHRRDLFEYSTPVPSLLLSDSPDNNENEDDKDNSYEGESTGATLTLEDEEVNNEEVNNVKVEKVVDDEDDCDNETEGDSSILNKKGRDSSGGAKVKGQKIQDVTEEGSSSSDENNESGVQTNQKSAGSQAKERKSASSVAHFGTVYQPAGPLIEPHKSPSTSTTTGLLPETVKLPPDLKVTYQTHPPPSSHNPSTISHPYSTSKTSGTGGGGPSGRTKHSTSSHSSHHKDKSSSSSPGHILHQPYKSSSSSQSASSSSLRQQGYSSSGNAAAGSSSSVTSSYVNVINPATATGSPLLLSQPAAAMSQGHGHGHGHHSVHHSHSQHISASQSQPGASGGAPSQGGLFYSTSTGFAPHHSPFAPNKYPMVPESYRTQSPYQNSFLYPSTTPAQQQSQQSYFMTPFYTPPLTPNSGLGPVVGAHHHPRPLALTHPSMASASFYPQQSAHLQPGIGLHPSSYLVASPHHSLQPTPPPVGAGVGRHFPPNPSTQQACPCPTESCPPNSTNNNKLPQQQCVSNVLHPVHLPEMGVAVNQKALSTTRRSRQGQPPIFSEEDTPPITIQLLTPANHPHHHPHLHHSQDVHHNRQMESAKTFTEQYSLPDDITITPIIVNNSSNNGSALLLKNTSISLITPPTNAPKPTQTNSRTSAGTGTLPPNVNSKKKERDIVHVIDPRSGHKTTIAKHISNRNLLVKGNVNKGSRVQAQGIPNPNAHPVGGGRAAGTGMMGVGSSPKKIGVGKLNPDLDVIVINNNNDNGSSGGGVEVDLDCDDSITENLAQHQHPYNRKKLAMQQPQVGKKGKNKSSSSMSMLQQNLTPAHGNSNKSLISGPAPAPGRRTALMVNDASRSLQTVPINYSLPPGISISSGGGGGGGNSNQNQNQGLNLTVNKSRNNHHHHNDPNIVQVQAVQNLHHTQGKKRISLNDCIDGLQKKKLKVLEDPQNLVGVGVGPVLKNHSILNGSRTSGNFNALSNKARGGGGPRQFIPANIHHPSTLPSNFNNTNNSNGIVLPVSNNNGKKKSGKLPPVDSSYSSARVRDPQLHRGGTVIKSSDALAAVSALVVDPDNYHLKNSRLGNGKGLKNGFTKRGGNKLYSGKGLKSSYLPPRDLNFVVGVSKVKSKGMSLEKAAANYLSTRNTRSTAANAKIRTRFSSNRPKGGGGGGSGDSSSGLNSPRNRSRLLRKGNQIIGVVVTGLGSSLGGSSRRSESDSSTNTSRSNSAVRIINGNVSSYSNTGRFERENRKYPTAAFINAVADLYQYRRNVLLRVPRAGVGIFPSASSVNLEKGSTPSPSLSPGQERSFQQISPPTFTVPNHNVASLPRSSSPATPTGESAAASSKGPVGSMAANAAKKRAMVKPLSPQAINGALLQMGMARQLRTPKWSNGWRFEGEPYEARVFLNNDDPPVLRRCYPAMRHEGGDVIQTRDCVLLKSGSKKNDLPYIAKIATLWENPADGEMMSTLLWYYRPEHTEMGRQKEDMIDEIFASKHIDVNSVATIDDRCYVLTFNEYCRYRKRLKQLQEGLPNKPLLSLGGSAMHNNAAGAIAGAVWSGRPTAEEPNRPQSPGKISPEVVFFCRKVYDFRQKRIMKNPS